jgi:hypothetical protein
VDISYNTDLRSLCIYDWLLYPYAKEPTMFACLPQLLSQITSDQLRKIELGIHIWGREDIDSPAWKAIEKTLGRPQFQRLREISFKLNTPVTLDRKMLGSHQTAAANMHCTRASYCWLLGYYIFFSQTDELCYVL